MLVLAVSLDKNAPQSRHVYSSKTQVHDYLTWIIINIIIMKDAS